jgi:hypothetical protein
MLTVAIYYVPRLEAPRARPLIKLLLAPVAHSAKSEAPAAGRCAGARRASGEERCAESAERCAPSEGPRAPGLRDGKRRAAGVERKAASQALSSKCAGQKTDGSHLADLGFGMARVTRIETRVEGFAVPPGGEGCEKHRGRICQSAWWPRGGYLFSKKNPRARLPRAHAVGPVGGSGRVTHDRFALVSWFCWLFCSHGNSFRNPPRTNAPRRKTTSETS